ncbi:MAG: lipid II:glycine glycyltransferase FemX [Anaerolineaceae bacterium]
MHIVKKSEWDNWLSHQKNYHILQTSQWGSVKENFGWQSFRIINAEVGAQILFRKLPLGLKIAYIPKGPIGHPTMSFWAQVDELCRAQKAVFLKIEPDLWESEKFNILEEDPHRFLPSATIQPRQTIVVNLAGDEDVWLNRMKQKTRYNTKLAEKKEVCIQESGDIETFFRIMVSTGNRDNFGIHSKEYYTEVYNQFKATGKILLLLAYYQDQPLAGLIAFHQGNRAWYFYGASNEIERNRMPTYLLQLGAMRWAVLNGCTQYDLWGIPDENEEILEKEFLKRTDGLWGVYRFKRGFGGEIKRYHTAYDRVYNKAIYKLYQLYSSRRAVL